MSENQPRSTFVTVVAWIFIVLSGFVTLISILQNIMIQVMWSNPEFENAPQALPPDAPAMTVFMAAHARWFFRAMLLLSAWLLISSIGLLKRWNWARVCFICLMVLGIVFQIVGLWFQFSMVPSMQEQFATEPHASPGAGFFVISILVVNVLIAAAVTILFGWIIKRLVSLRIAAEFGR